MSREGVAIKVKIGLKPSGKGEMWADYPDWNKLPLAASTPVQNHQIVKWKYDKCCGHQEDSVDSPVGMQWGMMVVTEQFANEAVAMYPDTVSVMTEAEAEDFWNNKACSHIPENRVDSKVLGDLNIELQLRTALNEDTTALKAKIVKALDPTDSEVGLAKEKEKFFADAKGNIGFTIKE